jgi:hypothetical protein
MIEAQPSRCLTHRHAPLAQLRIWHLALLVLYVAIAIVDIREQHLSDPVLITLASVGFAGYGVLAWLTWQMVRRFEARIGRQPLLILYLIGMAALFFVATVIYLVIEQAYHVGFFRVLRYLLR